MDLADAGTRAPCDPPPPGSERLVGAAAAPTAAKGSGATNIGNVNSNSQNINMTQDEANSKTSSPWNEPIISSGAVIIDSQACSSNSSGACNVSNNRGMGIGTSSRSGKSGVPTAYRASAYASQALVSSPVSALPLSRSQPPGLALTFATRTHGCLLYTSPSPRD